MPEPTLSELTDFVNQFHTDTIADLDEISIALNAVIGFLKQVTTQMDYLNYEILKHRTVEFEKPKYGMKELIRDFEELQGRVEYLTRKIDGRKPFEVTKPREGFAVDNT